MQPGRPVAAGVDAPLAGIGVVVTRDESDDGPLTAALRRRGARVLRWPVVRTRAPARETRLVAALSAPADFDWLVLTSRRAVHAVADRIDQAVVPGWKVAAVGEGTAAAARARGMTVDLVPETQTADGLVAALARAGVARGSRVLFPASEIARDTLERGLTALGAEVTRVTAYRTVAVPLDRDRCRTAFDEGAVDVVSFTSPSALEALRDALGDELFARVGSAAALAAIGPTTGAAVRAVHGGPVIEAVDHSFEGLADAIAEWATNRARGEG